MSTWRILDGDCREVLRTLPEASVDVCVTDPPYGETSLAWDVRQGGWLSEVIRLLKPHGSMWCFGSLRSFMASAGDFESAGFVLAQDVVWEKHNGSGSAADRFRRVHEQAAHFYPRARAWRDVYKLPQTTPDARARKVLRRASPAQWGKLGAATYESQDGGPRLMRSVIYARSCHGHAVHQTQKPEAILVPFIRYSCPPDGVVLDPFAGSGSTGLAAQLAGVNFIGVELRPECAALARRRLSGDVRGDAPLLATQATGTEG